MRIEQRGKEWWIVDTEPYKVDGIEYNEYGPYPKRKDAQQDMRGVIKTLERWKKTSENGLVP